MLTEMLINERDRVHSDAVWLGIELVAECETRRTMEVRAEAFWRKGAEVEATHRAAKEMVVELRASLSLLETARDAAHSELHDAPLITGVSFLFLLSLTSGVGPPALTHHELDPSLLNDAGQRAELTDERGKVLILEEAKKARAECDRLWRGLQAEVEVYEARQTALAERGQELTAARAELQVIAIGAQEECSTLLPLPAPGALSTMPSECVPLRRTFPGS